MFFAFFVVEGEVASAFFGGFPAIIRVVISHVADNAFVADVDVFAAISGASDG